MNLKRKLSTLLLLIGLATLGLYLASCHHNSTKPIKTGKPSLNFPPPQEVQVSIPANSTNFPFNFTHHQYLIAPFAESQNQGLSIASGWGYMDPLILSTAGNQYGLVYFSCDEIVKSFYCFYLVRNGHVISKVHGMGISFPHSVNAYQPPLLFFSNSKIVVLYEVGLNNGTSAITLIYTDTASPDPLEWTEGPTFTTSRGTLNYLGGAISPDGKIYISGLDLESPSQPAISLITLDTKNWSWSDKFVLRQFSSQAQTPVYPHVQVRRNGEIEILFTLLNNLPCDEDGNRYSESYKSVYSIRGTPGQPFSTTFSDSATDVTISAPGGDSCLYHKQRFPMAQFYDYDNDLVYSVIKSSNVPVIIPNKKVQSNLNFDRKFMVYANGNLINANLENQFLNYFQSGNDIWAISGTILANGTKVFAAANDGLTPSFNDIAFISSSDLQNFSNVFLLEAPDLPGHSVHFAQPFKNGSDSENSLNFFHSGTVYEDKNNHHKFNFYKAQFTN